MADWGLLGGLGAGLSEVGGAQFKNVLADKLEKSREDRAQQRALKKVDPNLSGLVNENGQFYYVNRNINGDEISRRPATDMEISGAKMAEEELKGKRLANEQAAFKVDTQDEAFDLDRRGALADLDYKGALTESARNKNTEWSLLSPEERRRAALVQSDLLPGANAQLSARTSLSTAITRAGSESNNEFADSPVLSLLNTTGIKEIAQNATEGRDALTDAEVRMVAENTIQSIEQKWARPDLADKKPTKDDFAKVFAEGIAAVKRQKSGGTGVVVPKKGAFSLGKKE